MRLILLTILLFFSAVSNAQYSETKQARLDSLNQLIDTPGNDTILMQAHLALADELYAKNFDTIAGFSNKAIEIANRNLKDSKLTVREIFVFKSGKADGISNLGYARIRSGDYRSGLDYYLASLKIREEIDDKIGLSGAYNNIGAVYNNMGSYDEALDYYRKSVALRVLYADENKQALGYNNLGYTFHQMEVYDSALFYYNVSRNLYIKNDNKLRAAMTTTNIGAVYRAQGELDTAMTYFLTGLEQRRKYGSYTGLVYSLQNISSLYMEMNEYEKARPFILEAYDLSEETQEPKHVMRSALGMYQLYKHDGNYKKSLEHYEIYIAFKDSVKNNDLQKDLIKKTFEFEYSKKVTQDSIKVAEQQKVDDALLAAERAENEKREQQSYYLYGVLGLTLVFGFFILNRFLLTRKQKNQIEEQKAIVDEKNNEILDSINYAKGIQEAILPTQGRMTKLLGDHFILYRPKDIVAGDFYWVDQIEDIVVFAAADCTGHGVPGAMVSVVCHNALHRSIHEFNLMASAQILEKTRELVVETFESKEKEVKDGMDISLCALNTKSNVLQFSGAYNNLYLVRNGEMTEYKADKQPVGKHPNAQPFSMQEITLQKDDLIYIFTDGYPDQFGGEKGKKFKYKNFKQLLLNNSHLPLSEQKNLLNKTFDDWKGSIEQIDDVCVLGIRI